MPSPRVCASIRYCRRYRSHRKSQFTLRGRWACERRTSPCTHTRRMKSVKVLNAAVGGMGNHQADPWEAPSAFSRSSSVERERKRTGGRHRCLPRGQRPSSLLGESWADVSATGLLAPSADPLAESWGVSVRIRAANFCLSHPNRRRTQSTKPRIADHPTNDTPRTMTVWGNAWVLSRLDARPTGENSYARSLAPAR